MRKFKISFLCLLILLSLVNSSQAEESKIKIGVLTALSGDFASYGKVVKDAVERVSAPRVKWIFENDGCEVKQTLSSFKKLVTIDKVKFIIGPICGSSQKALAPLVNSHHAIVVFPNATSELLYKDSKNTLFSSQYSVETEARFIADQMNRRSLKKVAIISVDSDFSRSMERGFLERYKGEVMFSLYAPSFDNQFMKSAALKLRTVDFDSIFLADISPMLLGFLTELKKAGLSTKPTFTSYGAQNLDVITAEGKNADGVLYSYPDISEDENAFGYFPNLAAKVLSSVVGECEGDLNCVKTSLIRTDKLGSSGHFLGGLSLKMIKDGQFARVK